MKRLPFALMPLALAACVSPPAEAPPSLPKAAGCDAAESGRIATHLTRQDADKALAPNKRINHSLEHLRRE